MAQDGSQSPDAIFKTEEEEQEETVADETLRAQPIPYDPNDELTLLDDDQIDNLVLKTLRDMQESKFNEPIDFFVTSQDFFEGLAKPVTVLPCEPDLLPEVDDEASKEIFPTTDVAIARDLGYTCAFCGSGAGWYGLQRQLIEVRSGNRLSCFACLRQRCKRWSDTHQPHHIDDPENLPGRLPGPRKRIIQFDQILPTQQLYDR